MIGRKLIISLLRVFSIEIRRTRTNSDHLMIELVKPAEIPAAIWDVIIRIYTSQLTMVSLERLIATANSAIYVCKNNLPGAFVECGVWRGGNAILATKIFEFYGKENNVYLYDTFDGMVPPTTEDFSPIIGSAEEIFAAKEADGEKWCFATVDDVVQNFDQFTAPLSNVVIIKGDVLETLSLSVNVPNQIAILRLDTDWYESTRYEMQILFPRVISQGIIMFDDYGFWGGHQKAINEYFVDKGLNPHMSYVDESCRLIVKQ